MNLNKVIILGRVTAAPQLRSTNAGQSVTTFSVATNRQWITKDGQKHEEAEFHQVVAWAKQAEIASAYLAKGALVLVEGRLQTRSWEDKEGQTRRVTEIIAENIQLGPKPGEKAATIPKEKPLHVREEDLAAEGAIPPIDLDDDQETGREFKQTF